MGTSGQLIWSVNLTPTTGLEDRRSLQDGASATLELFRRHQMPATWTASDPAAQAAICRQVQRFPGQDVGLLGDDSWIGVGRTTFARELTRRAEAARAAGIPICCLATGGASLDNNLDILVRHRIATIRVDGAQWGMASSRRYGIWQLSVTDALPGRGGLWGGRFGYRRLVRQCARQRLTTMLVVDAVKLADPAAQKLLDHVCRYAAKQSNLVVSEFAQLARRMVSPTAATGSGSILRAA